MSTTLSNGLKQIDVGEINWVNVYNENIAALDIGRWKAGTLASRPAASAWEDSFYFATDEQKVYYSNGSAWASATGGATVVEFHHLGTEGKNFTIDLTDIGGVDYSDGNTYRPIDVFRGSDGTLMNYDCKITLAADEINIDLYEDIEVYVIFQSY